MTSANGKTIMDNVKNVQLHNNAISINKNTNISGLTLVSLWDVVGDSNSYQVVWPNDRWLPLRENTVVAVYSHTGHGEVHLSNKKIICLNGHCVVFLKPTEITRYFCSGLVWELNWIEFLVTGAISFPFEKVINLGNNISLSEIQEALVNLKRPEESYQQLGVAIVNKLIYQWLTYIDIQGSLSWDREKVNKVITEIHLNIEKKWTVAELAEVISCSESQLRRLFSLSVHKSPKAYLVDSKLDYAFTLLKHKQCTIKEVVNLLGFYDTFHFSKAFKARFGISPSTIE